MIHWFFISAGIIFLSASVSTPFYRILCSKTSFDFSKYNFLIRFFLLFIGITLVFIGLYIESIN